MSWKGIISSHLKNRLPTETNSDLSTIDLASKLLEKGMIPETIKRNATLHEVLLSEILLKTLESIKVPLAQRGEEELSAKEVLFWEIGRKGVERVKDLERETGVSLEYYHRLNRRKSVLGALSQVKQTEECVGSTYSDQGKG